ncbi:hypothetical protein MBLNU457_g0223t1 [Dothideomycetes sp. NU457]
MSKRGMEMQGGSERYGGPGGAETPADTPTKATAAQLARRKIATLKGPRSSRSASPTKTTAAPSFGGFGQDQFQQQPQQTGGGFTFGQSAPAPQQSNPFGQSQPATNGGFSFGQQTGGGSFTFGQSQPSNSFSFGGTPSSSSFPPADGNNQMNTNNNQFSFGASQPVPQSSFSGSIFNFGGASNTSKPANQTFGNNDSGMMDASDEASSQTQPQTPAAPASSNTPFGQQTPAASNPFASLARNPSNDSQSTGGFTFGQKPAESQSPAQAKTTQPSFSFGSKPAEQPASPQPSSSNIFGFGSKPTETPQSPAPATPAAQSASMFSKPAESAQTPASKPAFGGFSFTPKPADTEPTATPDKPSSGAFGFPSKPADTTTNSTPKPAEPATSGGFSFTPKPAPTQQPAQESTPKPASGGFSFTPKPAETQKTPFQTQNAPAPNAFNFGAPSSQPTPSSANIFSQSAQKPTQNGSASPAPPKPAQPPASSFSSPVPPSATNNSSVKSTDTTAKITELNKALLQHLQSSPLDHDWSAPLSYYMTQCRKIRALLAETQSPTASKKHAREEEQDTTAPPAKKTTFSASSSSPQKPLTATASLFNNILDSPQPSQTTAKPAFVPPPAPGSATPFTPAGGIPKAAPAPPAFSVPKFGSGSGAAPTDFFAAFSKQAKAKEEEEKQKRKDEDFDSDDDDPEEWERQDKEKQEAKRKALLEKGAQKVLKNVGGQFILVDANEDAQASPAPAVSNPLPALNTSVFDTKGPSKAPVSNASNPFAHLATPVSAQGGADDDDGTDEEDAEGTADNKAVAATPAKSGGLFGRVEQPNEQTSQIWRGQGAIGTSHTQTGAAMRQPPHNLDQGSFGKSTSSQDGDKTWKPESPIKFGNTGSTTPEGSPAKPAPLFNFGAPANQASTNGTSSDKPSENKPFSGLFGAKPAEQKASSSASSIFANLNSSAPATSGKAGMGFQFGGPGTNSVFGGASSTTQSQDVSRATTPGANIGDDTSTAAGTENEADGDAAPPEEQRDLTSLTAEERKTEDVLFEQKSRCRKFVKGDSDPWQTKGVGIIRLLKNKETGNVRVLMRQDPNGTIMVNANIIKNKAMYSALNEKQIKMVFAEKDGLNTFSMGFGTKEKAEQLLTAIQGQIE